MSLLAPTKFEILEGDLTCAVCPDSADVRVRMNCCGHHHVLCNLHWEWCKKDMTSHASSVGAGCRLCNHRWPPGVKLEDMVKEIPL